MSSPVLPIEIWEHIVSFLPQTFVQTLYSVNSPLLQIALNSKYEVAVVDASAKKPYRISPRNLHACGRVRKVVVQDNCNPRTCAPSDCHHEVGCIKTANPGTFRRILSTLNSLKLSISSSISIPVNRFYKEAKQVVFRMTGVDEIDLCLAVFTEIEYLPKLHFTRDLLRVSSDNIRKLYLDCALDSLGHAMDADLILPRLSTLRLSLRIVFPSPQPEKLISPMKTILVNNHQSITDLELYFSHTVNPHDFVQNLPTFPLLSRLLLGFPILDPNKEHLQNLTKFISQHKFQLSALDLYVKNNPFHFQNSIPLPTMFKIGATSVLVDFPKLADLTLNMYPMWISGINNQQYIGRYQSTLESLQLQTCILAFTDLQELFFNNNLPRLRRLAMTLTCLSPRHLSLFADALPGLKHLLLHVILHVTSDPHANTQQAAPLPPFSLDVPVVVNASSQWGLTSIVLPSNSHLKGIPMQDRKALVSALPNVCSFCEVDPDEYATAVDDPGVALKMRGGYWGARYHPDFYPAQ